MRVINVGSGSKGNCTIVSSGSGHIMIDCGIGITRIRQALKHYDIDHIDALVLTHRHSDHIKSLSYFKEIPMYTMDPSLPYQVLMQPNASYIIHGLTMVSFPLSHDAPYTCGVKIGDDHESIMIVTDTGYVSDAVVSIGYDSTYLMVECNHDIQMLLNTSRPYPLKARILGDEGHLNNEDGAKAMIRMIGPHTKYLFAAHISQQANDPSLVDSLLHTMVEPLHRQDLSITTLDQDHLICKGAL